MIRISLSLVSLTCLTSLGLFADEAKTVTVCPITQRPVTADHQTTYEEKAYQFCSEGCVAKFKKARAESLYDQIGGKAALSATVDLFYKKLLADDRVSDFFEDVNMKRQHNRQKAFIAAALGGPEPWTGKDLRKAHASLDLTEKDFGIIAVHLQASMEELKVDPANVSKIMAIVGSTKDAVLNRPEK